METRRSVYKPIALWLVWALALPGPALALRPSQAAGNAGLEEELSDALTTGISKPRAGLEEILERTLAEGRSLFPEHEYGWAQAIKDPQARVVADTRWTSVGDWEVPTLRLRLDRAVRGENRYEGPFDCLECGYWLVRRLRDQGVEARMVTVETPLWDVDFGVLVGERLISLTPGVDPEHPEVRKGGAYSLREAQARWDERASFLPIEAQLLPLAYERDEEEGYEAIVLGGFNLNRNHFWNGSVRAGDTVELVIQAEAVKDGRPVLRAALTYSRPLGDLPEVQRKLSAVGPEEAVQVLGLEPEWKVLDPQRGGDPAVRRRLETTLEAHSDLFGHLLGKIDLESGWIAESLSGLEETYSDPGALLRDLLRRPANGDSFEERVRRFGEEGRLVDSTGARLDPNSQLPFQFAARAVDGWARTLPQGAKADLSTLRAQLTPLPEGTEGWGHVEFLRWLLEQDAAGDLTVVQRVSLYQVAFESSFANRTALMAASALDALELAEGESLSLSALRDQLTPLPKKTEGWGHVEFLRWLLKQDAAKDLTVNQRVYLYRVAFGPSFADRTASMAASALDALELAEGESLSLSALRDQLTPLPKKTDGWGYVEFLRWLLKQDAAGDLTVVQRVYLYQVAFGPSFANRSALMAASALDHLGEPRNKLNRTDQGALTYSTHLRPREALNALARGYRAQLAGGDAPSQLGLAAHFLNAAVDGKLPRVRGSGGLAGATYLSYLPVLSNQFFRRWLAAWWAGDFAEKAGPVLEEHAPSAAGVIVGYLQKASGVFEPADVPGTKEKEQGRIAAGLVLLGKARSSWLKAAPESARGEEHPLARLLSQLSGQIEYLRKTQPADAASALEEEGHLEALDPRLARKEEPEAFARAVHRSAEQGDAKVAVLIDPGVLEVPAGWNALDLRVALIGWGGVLKHRLDLPERVDLKVGLWDGEQGPNARSYLESLGFRIVRVTRQEGAGGRLPLAAVPLAVVDALASGKEVFRLKPAIYRLEVGERTIEEVLQDLESIFFA